MESGSSVKRPHHFLDDGVGVTWSLRKPVLQEGQKLRSGRVERMWEKWMKNGEERVLKSILTLALMSAFQAFLGPILLMELI